MYKCERLKTLFECQCESQFQRLANANNRKFFAVYGRHFSIMLMDLYIPMNKHAIV